MNLVEKILKIPKEKRIRFMKLFIVFSVPMIFSVLYDLIKTFVFQSSYLTILWTLLFTVVWALLASWLGKSGIGLKKAFLWSHSFMIFGSLMSIISVVFMPNTPEFIKTLAIAFNYYMMTVEGFSVAALGHFARVYESYYLYIPIFPIVGVIWLMAIFIVAYKDK